MDRLKDRLQYAYERAEIEARKKGKKYKKYYDQEAGTSLLLPGDRVLVQKKGVQGKHWRYLGKKSLFSKEATNARYSSVFSTERKLK